MAIRACVAGAASAGRHGRDGHASFTIGERERSGSFRSRRPPVITQSFDRELRVLEEAMKRLNAEYAKQFGMENQ